MLTSYVINILMSKIVDYGFIVDDFVSYIFKFLLQWVDSKIFKIYTVFAKQKKNEFMIKYGKINNIIKSSKINRFILMNIV